MERITDQQYAVEVDTALEAFWLTEQDLTQQYGFAVSAVYRTVGRRPVGEKPYAYDRNPKPEASLEQALALLDAAIAKPNSEKAYDEFGAEKVKAKYEAARAALVECKQAQEPFNQEYREERWTRAWLVLNTGGHIHSTRACSTCFVTTPFGWLPQVSGMDEAEIVAQAGEAACTVCYPSAPVASLSQPRRLFHQTEVEAQQAREERAKAKEERAAKKAAKAIANPDGSPLKVFEGIYTNHRTKEPYERYETIETLAAAKIWLTDSQEAWRSPAKPENVKAVAEAIAHKNGTTPEDEIAAAAKCAAKRK